MKSSSSRSSSSAATKVSQPTEPNSDSPSEEPGRSGSWLARVWARYSPHGELPVSSAVSTAFHVLLLALIPLLALRLLPKDPTPPAVDVIQVSDALDAASGEGPGESPTTGLEATEPAPTDQELPESLPREQVQTTPEFKPVEKVPTVDTATDQIQQDVEKASQTARDAAEKFAQAKDRLKRNLEQGSGGGGGSGNKGRAARPARWILNVRYSTTDSYLEQLEGLGAVIAFPASGDNWRFFDKPSSAPQRSELRSLANENRLYWITEDAQVVRGVAQALGLPNQVGLPMFLPLDLENRMLRMELDFQKLKESEITSTRFECINRGGMYDVQVVDQLPRVARP